MLTEEDIYYLTRRTPCRDWLDSGDTRPFEEYKQWWESIHGKFE
jgi:hypothetical protein